MNSKELLIRTLERKPPLPGRVPHFELVFYLTMEVFGRLHPTHRLYSQWDQMSERERQLHRQDMADIYLAIAEKYDHAAIFIHPDPRIFPGTCYEEETLKLIDLIRDKSGDKYLLMMHGDATYGIPDGANLEKFIYRIADEPEKVKVDAGRMVDDALRSAEKLAKHGGLDAFALCSDYCFNSGPFLSPGMFAEYVTPYLARLTGGYREMGFYVIKHTDGNIMPILDQLVQTNPHCLHSLDPQAGVDIAEVKRIAGDKVCLMGNVNCGLLQTGTDEEVIESARYALRSGMPGGGYIFSTSNCIFTGMDPERYHLIHKIWREDGIYR